MTERWEDGEGRPLWEIPEWMDTSKRLHVDWEGEPINLLGYVCLNEDDSYRWVARTHLVRWGLYISTIWLGIDMAFGRGRPIVFETMVFMEDSVLKNREYSDLQFRHHTRDEALVEHGLIVEGIIQGRSGEEIYDILYASDLVPEPDNVEQT